MMEQHELRVGFAFCGSFCTMRESLNCLRGAAERYGQVIPIVSQAVAATDTRFGRAEDFLREMEEICGRPPLATVAEVEPLGGKKLLDVLVICPCTGNTLAKLAHGVTDGPVTMAAKAHLRNGRPVVLALTTNDGLSGSAANIGTLLGRKNVYFVPFGQDDPVEKPTSLGAVLSRLEETVEGAVRGVQVQPVVQSPLP